MLKHRCQNRGNKSATVGGYDSQLWGHYQDVTVSMISVVNEVCKCRNKDIFSAP